MKTAIYPLSADPITRGHLDIIERALKLFDRLILAVGLNLQKQYLFSLKERVELVKKATWHLQNIEVEGFEGLLTDFARKKNLHLIVRGFRNSNDYLHELNLYQNYLSQNPNLEFVNLFSSNRFISSTAVKEIASLGGQIHTSVPFVSKIAVEKKLHNRRFLGITGEIATGKTWLANWIKQNFSTLKSPIHHIDFDWLTSEVLKLENVKLEMENTFGKEIFENKKVSKILLKQKLLKNPKKLQILNQITHSHILQLCREKVKNLSGLVLLEIPLLTEVNWEFLVNNQVILTQTNFKKQLKNLQKRGLSNLEIEFFIKNQYSFEQKKQAIQEAVRAENFGNLWEVDVFDSDLKNVIESVFEIINF